MLPEHETSSDEAPESQDPPDETVPRIKPDDETPSGATAESHDEINLHDLPLDHPGRRAAEEVARSEAAASERD